MQVIIIHEENHGFIGTATTMKAAFRFLIEHKWLTPEFDLYDEATGVWYTLRSVFRAKGIEPTKENILAWAMEYADDAYLQECIDNLRGKGIDVSEMEKLLNR